MDASVMVIDGLDDDDPSIASLSLLAQYGE